MSSILKPSFGVIVLFLWIGKRPFMRSICLTSVEIILESDETVASTVRSCGTSVCVKRCDFRLLLWLKLRPHTGHLCGDSSMCRILWTARVLLWQNPLPHSLHLNGFSLLCMYLEWKRFLTALNSSWLFFFFFFLLLYFLSV